MPKRWSIHTHSRYLCFAAYAYTHVCIYIRRDRETDASKQASHTERGLCDSHPSGFESKCSGSNLTKCGKHVRHLMFEFCDRACLHSSWVGDDIAIPGSVASAAKSIGPTHCHPQPLEPPLIILVGPRLSIWLAGWRVWCLAGGLIKDSGLLGCLARCSSAEQRVRHSRARQIGLSVRLRVLWCARLTYTSDWVRRSARLIRVPDCQIGCCARLARLALAPDCQIGALVRLGLFLFRPPAERLGALLQPGRQIELNARLPKTLVYQIFNRCPD